MKMDRHHDARLHVTGRAQYVDDLPSPPGTLWVQPVPSPVAHGLLRSIDPAAALAMRGVHRVLTAADIPGDGLIGPIVHDEPLLAQDKVHCVGQPVALVVADTRELAQRAAAAVRLDIVPHPALLTMDAAIEAGSTHGTPHVIARGDVDDALAQAQVVVRGEMRCGGQDHFYLETQAALVQPTDDGGFHIQSSTQHPTEIQKMAAHVLGIGAHRIVCEVPRMGGGFGGKESQATQPACWATLASWATGRPCRVRLSRHEDMAWTGGRHPFLGRYEAGFTAEGDLQALRVQLYANGGWSQDLSIPILDRAMFHADNAYFIPHLRFEGHALRTHLPSNTAFRGFGGPQGMLVVEQALDHFAEQQGLDPAAVRVRNLYREGQSTPYGQVLEEVRLQRIWDELSTSSDYAARRQSVQTGWVRRGMGFQPIKFGISFTASLLNQAGALVLVFADGSVQLNHGGTEMGQGLHAKMLQVCSVELGIPTDRIRVMRTATDKVPNTSATAASSGADLNGQAVRDACRQLRERMDAVRAEMPGDPSFAQVATQCWVNQISLAAAGFYATPGIGYDREAGRGRPFFYFAYGGAVCEVAINALTGEYRLLRADILHDVGDSLLPGVDRGQVEGGFVQGMGWLTAEELHVRDDGSAVTVGPSTYKIPSIGDIPRDFTVRLLEKAPQPGVIHGSKAVGEPPFMLAIAVVHALRDAISSFGPGPVELALPATPEAVLRAIAVQKGELPRSGR